MHIGFPRSFQKPRPLGHPHQPRCSAILSPRKHTHPLSVDPYPCLEMMQPSDISHPTPTLTDNGQRLPVCRSLKNAGHPTILEATVAQRT